MWSMLVVLAAVVLAGCAWAAHEGPFITPEEALTRLKEGNARFASGRSAHPRADAARRVETSAHGQHPFVSVLGCSDSRVPVEIVFDQGIGDVFVVRVPGNVCNADEIGALEYGIEHLNTPLCVVLGHTRCGAVTGVVQGAPLEGHLAHLVNNIRHALVAARRSSPPSSDDALIEATARENVRQSIRDLLQASASVKEKVHQRSLKLTGALYDVATGSVEWLDDVTV